MEALGDVCLQGEDETWEKCMVRKACDEKAEESVLRVWEAKAMASACDCSIA